MTECLEGCDARSIDSGVGFSNAKLEFSKVGCTFPLVSYFLSFFPFEGGSLSISSQPWICWEDPGGSIHSAVARLSARVAHDAYDNLTRSITCIQIWNLPIRSLENQTTKRG